MAANWAHIQSATGKGAHTGTTVLTLGAAVGAGNHLILSGYCDFATTGGGNANPSSNIVVTDNKGNTYTTKLNIPCASGTLSTGSEISWAAYCFNITNSPTVITISAFLGGTLVANAAPATVLDEFSGPLPFQSDYSYNDTASIGTAITGIPVHPDTNGSLIYASVVQDAAVLTAGAGFTLGNNTLGNVASEWMEQATAAVISPAFTTSIANQVARFAAFAFRVANIPPSVSLFPAFTPLVPPPPIGQGGGPAPTFPPTPPNTAPVPIPPGVLIGPAITLPTVIAGRALIIFGTGSATAPTVVSWFPSFTTTFPAPTFVVSNVWTVPTFAGGVWTSTLPARTATTQNVPIGGWGVPGPSGSGPGPPTYTNPPGAGRPFMVIGADASAPAAMNENASSEGVSATAEIPRRRRRASA